MSRYAMCPTCGHRLNREKDEFGNWDGTSYICINCSNLDDTDDYDDYDDYDDEDNLSVYEAALIWLSNGKDEDYTFGYDEEELEDALR